MIYCSCTGVNTSILKQAIQNGAQTLKDVYDIARQVNGTSAQQCKTIDARQSCATNLAQAWQAIAPDNIPTQVQKILDKQDSPQCTGNCTSCPNLKN